MGSAMTWAGLGWFALRVLLASLVSAVVFVIALPTKLGNRYLAFRFDKKLQAFKGEQDEKFAALNEKLSHLGDRGKRSNELEYKATSDVWEKCVEAFFATRACVMTFSQHQDLNQYTAEELEAFLMSTDLHEIQRKAVERADDKNRAFTVMTAYRATYVAGNTIYEAKILLRKNGIFIPGDLKHLFDAAIGLCEDARMQRSMESNLGRVGGSPIEDARKFMQEGEKAFDELMAATRERLLRKL